jgi:hypothetical protein
MMGLGLGFVAICLRPVIPGLTGRADLRNLRGCPHTWCEGTVGNCGLLGLT